MFALSTRHTALGVTGVVKISNLLLICNIQVSLLLQCTMPGGAPYLQRQVFRHSTLVDHKRNPTPIHVIFRSNVDACYFRGQMGACAGATKKPKRKTQLKSPKFKNRALCPLQPA